MGAGKLSDTQFTTRLTHLNLLSGIEGCEDASVFDIIDTRGIDVSSLRGTQLFVSSFSLSPSLSLSLTSLILLQITLQT